MPRIWFDAATDQRGRPPKIGRTNALKLFKLAEEAWTSEIDGCGMTALRLLPRWTGSR